jgi:hypothetical protein
MLICIIRDLFLIVDVFVKVTTLHQVTRVEGEVARMVAVLCYSQLDNIKNSPQVQKLFWGREKQ